MYSQQIKSFEVSDYQLCIASSLIALCSGSLSGVLYNCCRKNVDRTCSNKEIVFHLVYLISMLFFSFFFMIESYLFVTDNNKEADVQYKSNISFTKATKFMTLFHSIFFIGAYLISIAIPISPCIRRICNYNTDNNADNPIEYTQLMVSNSTTSSNIENPNMIQLDIEETSFSQQH